MASPLHAPSSSTVSSSSALSSKPPRLSAEDPSSVPPSFAPSQSSNPPAGTLNRPAFQSRQSTILPELPYDTSHHKTSITIIWTLLAFDVFIIPLALFYALWYGTHPRLDPAYLFAITTGVFGLISGAEWAFRGWSLWRRPELRPLGLNHDRHANDVRLEGGGPGVEHEGEERQNSEGALPTNDNGRQARKKKRWYTGWYYKLDFFHFSYTIGYSIGLVMKIPLCQMSPLLDLPIFRSSSSLAPPPPNPSSVCVLPQRPHSSSSMACSSASSPSISTQAARHRFEYHHSQVL